MRVIHLKYGKRALRDIFMNALPANVPVSWGRHPAIPRPKRPYCRLSIVSGPSAVLTDHDEVRQLETLDDATLTIDTAVVGNLYRVRLNGIPMDYTAVGGDDEEDIRDGVLAAINAEGLTDFWTVAASGLDSIDVTPTSPGSVFDIRLEPVSTMSKVENKSGELSQIQLGRRFFIARCNFFTDGERTIEDGAMDLASIARTALGSDFALNKMAQYRVPLRALLASQHLPELEAGGAEVESRAMFEVYMAMSSCAVEEITPIESVEVTTIVSGETNTFTVTIP